MAGFDFLEACRHAISIDSTSSHGNAEYVEFLKTILGEFDLNVRTQPVDSGEYRGLNLIAEKGGGPDVILFDTHLDTVSGGDPTLWTETGGDPFQATIKNGNLYGLGSADVKLDFLCKLKALEKFVGRRFRNRFILLGTFGEEVGLIGARAFLDDYRGQLDFALIGEPTSLKLVNRHKGRGCYRFSVPYAEDRMFDKTLSLEFRGKAAHSSTPGSGVNAIERALDFLSSCDTPPSYLDIRGGNLLNIIPDFCAVTVPADPACSDKARKAGVTVADGGSKKLAGADGIRRFWPSLRTEAKALTLSTETSWACVTARVDAAKRAFVFECDSRYWEEAESMSDQALSRIAADSAVIRRDASFFETSHAWHVEGLWGALRDAGLTPEFTSKMGSTEAALFGQRCTSLVFGPGHSEGNIHSPNERVAVADLEIAIRAYEHVLQRLVAVPA